MLRTLVLAAVAVAATGSAAVAADLLVPATPAPIVESANVGFEGLYAGVQLGGSFVEDVDTQAVLGGVIGYNFTTDPVLVGVEVQGNYAFENDDLGATGEVLALAKLGIAADNFAIYATGGFGYVWDDIVGDHSVYALGVGAELFVADDISIRGDILGFGTEDSDGFDSARATVGVLWHF
jgi:outer membrane immunogenic protein